MMRLRWLWCHDDMICHDDNNALWYDIWHDMTSPLWDTVWYAKYWNTVDGKNKKKTKKILRIYLKRPVILLGLETLANCNI